MAERRMFAKTIIDSDAFLDMPLSSQALYFHLSMRADDEGFVNNPKRVQRTVGASDDDMKVLLAKNFIIAFESGVIVIKHWKIHNYIRSDRLNKTKYEEERALLDTKDNGAYTLCEEVKQLDFLDSTDTRKMAYKHSSLPYSFSYKIRKVFVGKKCPICGCTLGYSNNLVKPTIQHNIPISLGGEHELGNISVICASCNTSIRNKETGELNNKEVIDMWDRIVYAEQNNIHWFNNPSVLDDVYQMSVTCPSNVSTDKDSIGKDSIDKNNQSIYQDIYTDIPGHKIGDRLTDSQWDALDSTYEDFIGLLDLINDRLKLSTETIKDEYAYIISVAKAERWATKKGVSV